MYRGKYNKYINGHNGYLAKLAQFKGHGTRDGYEWLHMPWHPNSNSRGEIYLHVLKMTQKLGRPLNKGEVVHHKDFNSLNNDIENLLLLPNQSKHMKIHRVVDTSGRVCFNCNKDGYEKNGLPKCRYKNDNENWICEACYRKIKRKKSS